MSVTGTLRALTATHLDSALANPSASNDVKRYLKQLAGTAADASITVSDEGATSANQRDITIQLKDAFGDDVAERCSVQILVFADANGDAFVSTGGSTGIAIGTDGALLALVAKKAFIAVSEADGDIDLTWTDTGTETFALGVQLPNGKLIITDAYANA